MQTKLLTISGENYSYIYIWTIIGKYAKTFYYKSIGPSKTKNTDIKHETRIDRENSEDIIENIL